MKSRILTLAALFVALSFSGVYAQNDAELNVSANIIGQLDLANVEDLFFGDIVAGTENIIVTADPSGNNTNASSNAQRGELSLTSSAGESDVIFTKSADQTLSGNILTLVSGSDELQVELQYFFDNGPSNGAYTFGDSVALNEGDLTLYIGGTIADADVATGSYTATVTYVVALDI